MNDPTPDDTCTVSLPEHVVDEIETRLDETRFESVDDYAAFALGLLLRQLDCGRDAEVEPAVEPESSETEEVRDRLESLGYL